MPQSDLLMPWRDALGNACVAIENAGGGRRRARAEALPLFARLGLDGFERRRTWELSGGMRQRVAFARTLLAGKDVLLLDEPFGALDAITRAELQEWLRAALATEPRTTVLVTHDIEEALLVCDRVAVMSAPAGPDRARARRGLRRRRAGGGDRLGTVPRGAVAGARGAAMRRALRHLGWIAVLAALIAAWQAYVRLRGVPQYVLPAPTDVARTLWDERGPLASAAAVTAREMLAGFAVALAFGLAAAVVLHASPTLRRAVYPLLVASQSVPVVAIAPILVIYLGFGLAPKLVIVALVCFFPITVAALDGFRSVAPSTCA